MVISYLVVMRAGILVLWHVKHLFQKLFNRFVTSKDMKIKMLILSYRPMILQALIKC